MIRMYIDTIIIASSILLASNKIHDEYGMIVASLSLAILSNVMQVELNPADGNVLKAMHIIPHGLLLLGLFSEFLPVHYVLVPIVFMFTLLIIHYVTSYKITIERVR